MKLFKSIFNKCVQKPNTTARNIQNSDNKPIFDNKTNTNKINVSDSSILKALEEAKNDGKSSSINYANSSAPAEKDGKNSTKKAKIGNKTIEFNIENDKLHGEGYEISAYNNPISRGIGSIFGGNFDSKDGKIDDSKQGATGDCWLLSGVNAINYTDEGKKCIEDALEYKDGYTIVHFKGGAGDYVVTDEEILATRGTTQYSSGDMDMVILEIAVEKFRNDVANGNVTFDYHSGAYVSDVPENNSSAGFPFISKSAVNGGHEAQLMYLLTGKKPVDYVYYEEYEDYLNKLNEGDAAITFGVPSKLYDINGKKIYNGEPHAFAVKAFDGENVTIVNPWDSSKEEVISLEELKSKANTFTYIDLSENNPKTEDISRNDDVTVEIEGTKYNAKILEFEGDNVLSGIILDNDSGYGVQFDKEGNYYVVAYDKDRNAYNKMFAISSDEVESALSGGLREYAENKEVVETASGADYTYKIIDGKKLLLNVKKDGAILQENGYDEKNRLISETKYDEKGEPKTKAEYEYLPNCDQLETTNEYEYDKETGEYTLTSVVSDYMYEIINGKEVPTSASRRYTESGKFETETYEYTTMLGEFYQSGVIRKEYGPLGMLGGATKTISTTYFPFDEFYFVYVSDSNGEKISLSKYDLLGKQIW